MMITGAILAMITVTVNGLVIGRSEIDTGAELALILADIIAYFIILISFSKLVNVSLVLSALEIVLMIVLFATSYAYGRKTRH